MANVVLLPPVTAVNPIVSVSTTEGLTSSTGIPSTSAACMAMEVLDPPMSVDPSVRLMDPSLLTAILQAESKPILNQNPIAIPLPWPDSLAV